MVRQLAPGIIWGCNAMRRRWLYHLSWGSCAWLMRDGDGLTFKINPFDDSVKRYCRRTRCNCMSHSLTKNISSLRGRLARKPEESQTHCLSKRLQHEWL